MTSRLILLVLAAVTVSQVFAGPLAFVGKENVFKYSIKIGKTAGSSFKQGLLLTLDVAARKKADETFSIKITNVEVRCHRNEAIEKTKYEELEKLLKVPFDFNPKDEHGLIIYGPDSTDTESANIKRGLVNLLEFYNADTKKVEKVAGKAGPSGTCPVHEMKKELADVEEDLRFPALDANCSAGKPHQYVKKNFVAHRGTYCELEPKVSRSIAYRVTHSKDGSDAPKILVKSTESIRLQSIFKGLFDEVQAHATLELVKIQDAAPEEALTTTTTKSCLEIKLKSSKPHDHSSEQEELLKKAEEGFKMLDHCIKRMDENPHLEEQTVAQTVAIITYSLKHLNKASLISLYNKLDSNMKQNFFQILALEPSSDAFDAVSEIFTNVWADSEANPYEMSEAIPTFFESLDHKGKGVSMKDVKKFSALLDKVEENDKSNTRLKNAIILAGSGIVYEACVRKGKQDENCSSQDEMLAKINSKDPENKDENMIVLKLKALSNMKIPAAIAYIKSQLEKQDNSLFVRSQAVWALLHFARRNTAEVKPIITKLFYDRKEDHEIRIASYIAMAMSSPSDMQSAVQYLIDNHDNEDRQVVSYVIASVNNLKSLKYPEGSKCRSFGDAARNLEGLVSSVAEKLGPKSLFDSSVYTFGSKDNSERLLLSMIAAKNDIIPRTVFIMIQDALQERSYSMHSVSDALLYNNLVQMKEAYEKMKKDSKVPIKETVKSQLDAIFEKVKGKPSDSYFAMAFAETIDGTTVSYEKYSKPDELIQRILSLTVSNEKYVRTFKKYNELAVKTHTETGLKVKFMTAQSAVSSFELPQFIMGQPGRQGIPFALRYGYRFVSKTAYLTIVDLPVASFKYVTGKLSDKSMTIPRNVTVHFMKKQNEKLTHFVVKVKSDPLVAKKEIDLLYRAMTPVEGNIESPLDIDKIIRHDKKPLDSHTHLHKYFGYGLVVSKSVDYSRPMPWRSPLSRFCPVYQELETESKPYKFKVALTASEGAATMNSYEVNVLHGIKGDNFIRMFAMTVTNPADVASKSVRFAAGISTNTKNPDKRLGLFSYENYVKKIFLRGSFETTMPSEAVSIPSVTKATDEWKNIYGGQKINIKAAFKYSQSARVEFGDDDINDLINGLGADADATGEAELYRTQEQIDLYKSTNGNAVDEATEENLYSVMISRSQAHPACSLKTWSSILKFHGLTGSVKFNKPLPDAIVDIQRRVRFLLTGMHWAESSFDFEEKAPEGTIMFWANSTVDSSRTDMGMKDASGTLKFDNIRAYALKYLRPSASPVRVYNSKSLNIPVCSIISEANRHEIETFSGRDIMTDELSEDCEYLLTSNCRGLKNFAITYSKKDHVYKILYDNKHEIVIDKDSLTVDGEKTGESDGISVFGDMIYTGRYKGIFGVALPNMVEIIREVGSPNAYIRASQLFRGRLCGLCGSHDGNGITDDVSSFGDFGINGKCPA